MLKIRLDGDISSSGVAGGTVPLTGSAVVPVGIVVPEAGDAGPDCGEEEDGDRDRGTIAPGVPAGVILLAKTQQHQSYIHTQYHSGSDTHDNEGEAHT